MREAHLEQYLIGIKKGIIMSRKGDKFTYYVIARFISSVGNWFHNIAFPLAVYQLTGSAIAMSISIMINIIPSLLLAPYCGFLADTRSRKKVMIISDLLRFLVIVIYLLCSSKLYFLYIVSCFLSVGNLFFTMSANSILPNLVANRNDDDVRKLNSIESLALNIAMVISPIIAGFVIERYGYNTAFFINALSFLSSALLLFKIPNDIRRANNQGNISVRETLRKVFNLKERMGIINKNDLLKSVIYISALFSLCGNIFMSLDAVYIKEFFQNSSEVYGYINTAWGIGMILSTTLLIAIKKISNLNLYCFSILGMGIATVGYGLSKVVVLSVIFNFIGGLANSIYMVSLKTIIQNEAADDQRGIFFSSQIILSQISSFVLLGITGALADVYGVAKIIVISGLITVTLSLFSFAQNQRIKESRSLHH